jgi:chromosome segregation ATPase
MNPAHPDPGEMLQRVRQQLILAQVRIMELEDTRDETGGRLAENEQLLQAAVALADRKLDEAAHAEKIRADLQAQFEQLQHIQQAASAALGTAHARLADTEQALAREKQASADLAAQLRQLRETHQELAAQFRETTAHAAARQQRIEQLDAEIRGMKTSRSWRWTAWLRSLERAFRGRPS